MVNSKIILGINTFHADSSACLLIDGKLIAAIEEERVNRIKHYAGFPSKAIKECLVIANIGENIDLHIIFILFRYFACRSRRRCRAGRCSGCS